MKNLELKKTYQIIKTHPFTIPFNFSEQLILVDTEKCYCIFIVLKDTFYNNECVSPVCPFYSGHHHPHAVTEHKTSSLCYSEDEIFFKTYACKCSICSAFANHVCHGWVVLERILDPLGLKLQNRKKNLKTAHLRYRTLIKY